MSETTTKAAIRVFTNEPSLDFISEALGVKPTSHYLRGQLRSKRNPQNGVFEESIWIYDSGLPDSSDLHEHFDGLLKILEPKRQSIEAIRNRITRMDIFAMFSSEHGQGSAELSAAVLKRLASQEIDLVVDLYPPN